LADFRHQKFKTKFTVSFREESPILPDVKEYDQPVLLEEGLFSTIRGHYMTPTQTRQFILKNNSLFVSPATS